MGPSTIRAAAESLLSDHGFPIPTSATPLPLASLYRATAFLAWRALDLAEEFSKGQLGCALPTADELTNAVQIVEGFYAGDGARHRAEWAARRAGRLVTYWEGARPEPLSAALASARKVLRCFAIAYKRHEQPTGSVVTASPWRGHATDSDPEETLAHVRELFTGPPVWIVMGAPVSREDLRFFIGEWADGARPPDPSALISEAWQDLAKWAAEWPAPEQAAGGDGPKTPAEPAPTAGKKPGRRPVPRRNEERDAWVAQRREKKPRPTWRQVFDDLTKLAPKKGWNPPESAKALAEAYYRYLKDQRGKEF